MLAWEHSGFSIDASVRIALIDRDVPSYFRSLEHLLRYCARPPFALERLSGSRGADGQIARIRYVLPSHKAANWVGPSRSRKSTRPGANGVVELTPFEFLDRLADLVPPPRKHRHRYHGVFGPNHKLRRAVTALAIRNIGKQREAATGGHVADGHATEGCCDAAHAHQKPRSRHLTDRLGQAHGPGGGGVSAGVSELRRRHPADRVQTVLFVRNHPWPSHCWQPPVAADILPAIQGRSGRFSRLSANRSNRRRSLPPVARRSTGESSWESSSRSTTTGRSFKPHPTSCPRSTSTASERCRTRGTKAPGRADWERVCAEARKTRPKRVRGVSRNPLRTPGTLLPRLPSRLSAGRPLGKCH